MRPQQPPDGPVDIYARVSRAGDKDQRSTTSQAAACAAVLAERGLDPGLTHIDDGRSAWNPRVQRPGWDALMGRLEAGQAAGVIVFDLERFTRQPREGERLIDAAERGLAVLDSDADFDLTTASGKKAFRDAMAAGAYYSDRLSDRIRRGKAAKARAGQVDRAGPLDRPFGWEADGITVREGEARWIPWLAGHLLHGDAQDGLARHLNARGVTTTQGKPWDAGKIRLVLLRERNRGNLTHRGVVVARLPGEPVLDSATFERVAAKYAARRPGRPYTRTYVASGMAFCAACGHQLSTRPRPQCAPYPDGSVQRQYWCKKHNGGGACGTVSIDQRALDEAAGALAVAILSDPRHAAAVEAAAAQAAGEAAELDALIGEAERTALAIGDRLGRGEITLDRHDAIMGPLDERLAGLRARREAAGQPGPVPAAASRGQWQRRWDGAGLDGRREMLSMALRGRRLVVAAGGRGVPAHERLTVE